MAVFLLDVFDIGYLIFHVQLVQIFWAQLKQLLWGSLIDLSVPMAVLLQDVIDICFMYNWCKSSGHSSNSSCGVVLYICGYLLWYFCRVYLIYDILCTTGANLPGKPQKAPGFGQIRFHEHWLNLCKFQWYRRYFCGVVLYVCEYFWVMLYMGRYILWQDVFDILCITDAVLFLACQIVFRWLPCYSRSGFAQCWSFLFARLLLRCSLSKKETLSWGIFLKYWIWKKFKDIWLLPQCNVWKPKC